MALISLAPYSRTLRASRMWTAVATLSRWLQTSIINVLTAHRSPRNQPGYGRCKECWARSVGHMEARTRSARTGANWSTNWTPRGGCATFAGNQHVFQMVEDCETLYYFYMPFSYALPPLQTLRVKVFVLKSDWIKQLLQLVWCSTLTSLVSFMCLH